MHHQRKSNSAANQSCVEPQHSKRVSARRVSYSSRPLSLLSERCCTRQSSCPIPKSRSRLPQSKAFGLLPKIRSSFSLHFLIRKLWLAPAEHSFGATIECDETATHIQLAANGVAMIQSSLRDEIDWRDCRPWVETHGALRRSLCDHGQEPKSRLRGTAWPTPTIRDLDNRSHLDKAADYPQPEGIRSR